MELGKVIITGCVGFIFSHVTEYLVRRGYEVHGIDNLSEGSHPEIIDGSFKFYKEDVSKKEVINTILNIEPDYIIHAAACSDVDYSIKDPRKVIQDNADATLNVFEAARQLPDLKKLVYISTDEVYGECDHKRVEDEIVFPKNPYSLSKAYGSLLRMAYDNTYPELKDKTAETRFCNIFGPRQDERKIIPLIKHALTTGETIKLHNGGVGYREYLHVSNIPQIVEKIMLEGDRTYNITLNEGYTVLELIQKAEQLTGKKIATVPAQRSGMDTVYQMDATRVREFGWEPLIGFDEAFKDYLHA
jgi:dTDP-glucose 4,6-dehydratase